MSTLVIGGTDFIGRRLIPLLAARGERLVCMDINPSTASFDELGDRVKVLRGDVTQFDDVIGVLSRGQVRTLIDLSYHIGSDLIRWPAPASWD